MRHLTAVRLAGLFVTVGVLAAYAIQAVGTVYIADSQNNRIRAVSLATGIITTVAGTGVAGYSGDGGTATTAELNNPYGVAVDLVGNLYIADSLNNRVRMVNRSTGVITTVAGTGVAGFAGDGGAATKPGCGIRLASRWTALGMSTSRIRETTESARSPAVRSVRSPVMG